MLGRFVVEEPVGRGGMGIVYKVRDPRSKMPYAAKVLNRAVACQRDFVKRFKHEAKAGKEFSHMSLVHVFLLKRWEDTWFYVMELLNGRPLTEVAQDSDVSFDRRLAILRDVASALDYLHSKRYVHRDIKPDNVLIRADGHLKIIDFGLAQKFGRATRTRFGEVMGTAKYMAPELINGANVSPATDIYALGVMAYELLSGRAPFDAGHTKVIMDMHLYMKPRPLHDVVDGIDKNLGIMVDRMLAKDPTRRLNSARLVQSLIEMYLASGRFPELPRRS